MVLTEKDVIRAHARDELGIGGQARAGHLLLLGHVTACTSGGTAWVADFWPMQTSLTVDALPKPVLSFVPPRADIDELSNPLQAAIVSAICFTVGAAIPLLSSAWVMASTLRLGILAGATTGGQCCWCFTSASRCVVSTASCQWAAYI